MRKLGEAFQLRYMIYQPKLADILAIDAIVPTLKGNAVIPHRSMTVYRLVQLNITVITIHLELVGFHQGLSVWISCPGYWRVGGKPYRAIGVAFSHK